MARYSPAFKNRAVARLLPPRASLPEVVAKEIGIGVNTLLRWQRDALSAPTLSALTLSKSIVATHARWLFRLTVYLLDLAKWAKPAAKVCHELLPMGAVIEVREAANILTKSLPASL